MTARELLEALQRLPVVDLDLPAVFTIPAEQIRSDLCATIRRGETVTYEICTANKRHLKVEGKESGWVGRFAIHLEAIIE